MRILLIALFCSSMVAMTSAESAAPAAKIRILLVGDSTVNKKTGWGDGLAARVTSDAEVINVAANGRSSKSYRDEGLWDKALKQKSDYMLIQFGHNDEPGKGPARETDPKTTYTENMKRFVTEAQAAGFKPILVTSLTRRQFTGGKLQPSLVAYSDAVRAIAKDMNVPLIDLNKSSSELCQKLGEKGTDPLSATTKDGKVDHTHVNESGSMVFGSLVADDLAKVVPDLAPFIKPAPPSTQP